MEAVVERGRKRLDPDLASACAQAARVVARVFRCWHLKMSRPLTLDGETYRACLACGARRRFDTARWETVGRYYYPPRPA